MRQERFVRLSSRYGARYERVVGVSSRYGTRRERVVGVYSRCGTSRIPRVTSGNPCNHPFDPSGAAGAVSRDLSRLITSPLVPKGGRGVPETPAGGGEPAR